MAKFVITFVLLTFIIHSAILAWRTATEKAKWSFVKTLFTSVAVAAIAGALLAGFVILF